MVVFMISITGSATTPHRQQTASSRCKVTAKYLRQSRLRTRQTVYTRNGHGLNCVILYYSLSRYCAVHVLICDRRLWFEMILVIDRRSFVMGLVWCTRSHCSIACRSYECPSAQTTGSTIT